MIARACLTVAARRQPRYYEAEVTLEDGSDAKQMINEQENLVKVGSRNRTTTRCKTEQVAYVAGRGDGGVGPLMRWLAG